VGAGRGGDPADEGARAEAGLTEAMKTSALWALQALFAARPLRTRLCWRAPRSSRRVALTFDDGPNEHTTPRVLDLLRSHGVRATFFVLGREARKWPEILRRIVGEGHEVGIHGYDHRPARLTAQVRDCAALLDCAGIRTRLVRPPAGRCGAGELFAQVWAGNATVLWSFDARDSMRAEGKWNGPAPDYARIAGGDIVLMHDDNEVCVKDVPEIVAAVRRNGLQPVTVGELIVVKRDYRTTGQQNCRESVVP
jgi:peptidoglycan-N-acetylglucosamine deacetylase